MLEQKSFTEAEWNTCIKVLQVLSRQPEAALDEMVLKGLVTKLSRAAKKRNRIRAANADRQILSSTEIWQSNAVANHPLRAFQAPPEGAGRRGRLNTPRRCYICKELFFEVHSHYHMHCPPCAEADFGKRSLRADLRGRTALITGARVKIGWQLALRLLRDGARVIATTRFPHDAAQRFGNESDFEQWRERLSIRALDLRNLPALEELTRELLKAGTPIDILINNAAQTIRRLPGFYEHLFAVESTPLPFHLKSLLHSSLESPSQGHSLIPSSGASEWFPAGLLDRDGQQVDLTPVNSWTLRAGEVSMNEMLEAILVNQSAPFVLASRLRPLMAGSKVFPRFIINVSAMEGQFERDNKTARHPHTNMPKAALNMFTRTSAQDFANDGIWMNSVDTGWITNENPAPKKDRVLEEQHFVPPLDVIDGMARIYDPIVCGIADPGSPYLGHFLKNYQPYPW